MLTLSVVYRVGVLTDACGGLNGLEEVCMCVYFASLGCAHSVDTLIYASSAVCTCPSV